MVEVFIVGVHTIVTSEAVFAPGRQVGIGKVGVQPTVTVHTGRGIKTGQIFCMTILADEWLIRGSKFVTRQRVIHNIMRKLCSCGSEGERGRRSAVFGVTVHATQIWIGVIHLAMCLGDFRHLRCHFGMAVRTAVSHALRRPGRDMT